MREKKLSTRLAGALIAVLAGAGLLAACGAGTEQGANWTLYGQDHAEQRFSPLTQIDADNIDRLGLAWSMDLPPQARSMQGTPLAIDGKLYFSTTLSIVHAVDAATGRQLWEYNPEVGAAHPRALRTSQQPSRGIGYHDGAIILATLDGRLISLDADSGTPNWITDTIDEGPEDTRKTITGAPRVFDDKIIVGNSGADFGTRGYVTTYDAATGEKLWRFHTVPGNPADGFESEAQEMAAATWEGEWWRWGGGGTVWNGITYDEEMDRIYIGVGNSSNYDPEQRSPGGGDNLFLASIVALDAETGEYIWHYQQNPREAWDFKATNAMILADLEIAGEQRPVLMQAAMNGFFYILDRRDGKLLSAEKFGKATWAERIELETGRPVEIENARYTEGPVTFYPSQLGVTNWQSPSYNPELGVVYIPTMQLPATYWTTEEKATEAEQFAIGNPHYEFALGSRFALADEDPADGTGGLLAWDPVKQQPLWQVKHNTGWNGGTLATASNLVFQGTADGQFKAYDGRSGAELWSFQANHGIIAPPITYLVDGEQYITVLVGYGAAAPDDPGWRYGRHMPQVLTFRLGGNATLPPAAPRFPEPEPIYDPDFVIDEQAAARGRDLLLRNCSICHVPGGATANWPDLRESPMAHDLDTLKKIVLEGALASQGMPQYDELTERDVRDIYMANKLFSKQAALGDDTAMEGSRLF